MASPVMTEACAQAAKRMISFQEQLVENGVKPATVSELMSSGVMVGEKRPIFTKLLTAATIIFPNSLPHDLDVYTQKLNEVWEREEKETVKIEVAEKFFQLRRTGGSTNDKSHIDIQNDQMLPDNFDKAKKNIIIFTTHHNTTHKEINNKQHNKKWRQN